MDAKKTAQDRATELSAEVARLEAKGQQAEERAARLKVERKAALLEGAVKARLDALAAKAFEAQQEAEDASVLLEDAREKLARAEVDARSEAMRESEATIRKLNDEAEELERAVYSRVSALAEGVRSWRQAVNQSRGIRRSLGQSVTVMDEVGNKIAAALVREGILDHRDLTANFTLLRRLTEEQNRKAEEKRRRAVAVIESLPTTEREEREGSAADFLASVMIPKDSLDPAQMGR